ncbi:MAG: hypothetical protein JSS32_05295 [Verrucomicrobia bacterium]|nr:hypothetical protein [Verrucomicrobiota bacterium]
MLPSVRNAGRSSIALCAISAIDIALWDLKAKLLNAPPITLLSGARYHIRRLPQPILIARSVNHECESCSANFFVAPDA